MYDEVERLRVAFGQAGHLLAHLTATFTRIRLTDPLTREETQKRSRRLLTQRQSCAKPSEGSSARGGPRTFNGGVRQPRKNGVDMGKGHG